ncbi:hypothetical protein [Arenimonas terrae]|uniref:Uncharacterized protein n=1 Tax=Arenimonas terrae TaxID=2546226 RepID=A0A5C4RP01_9GAMM|nr:hypothetical protein [Arenimonas terrae]TNJ32870.1 hypothetical protein E1B00_14250 [Arenimonas terrae]
MTRPKADAARSDRRRLVVVILLIVLGLGLTAAALWQRFSPEARAQAQTRAIADAAIVEFGRGLPKPFGPGPGLVLERVMFEGPHLVFVIRSTTRLATDAARDPQSLEGVRAAEQAQMVAFCNNPNLVYLLSRGMTATRRFVDARGDRFFDVSITAADCARTLVPART